MTDKNSSFDENDSDDQELSDDFSSDDQISDDNLNQRSPPLSDSLSVEDIDEANTQANKGDEGSSYSPQINSSSNEESEAENSDHLNDALDSEKFTHKKKFEDHDIDENSSEIKTIEKNHNIDDDSDEEEFTGFEVNEPSSNTEISDNFQNRDQETRIIREKSYEEIDETNEEKSIESSQNAVSQQYKTLDVNEFIVKNDTEESIVEKQRVTEDDSDGDESDNIYNKKDDVKGSDKELLDESLSSDSHHQVEGADAEVSDNEEQFEGFGTEEIEDQQEDAEQIREDEEQISDNDDHTKVDDEEDEGEEGAADSDAEEQFEGFEPTEIESSEPPTKMARKKDDEELIADIFGESDEEEEFTGFGDAELDGDKEDDAKKDFAASARAKDDDNDSLGELSDMEDSETAASRYPSDYISDFDLMMEEKKVERQRQRGRKRHRDSDIINDSDELISLMIQKMREAAEEDRELNRNKQAATRKIRMLPLVLSQLQKVDLQDYFLDNGILTALTDWLSPLPDKSLPSLKIREGLLKTLTIFPSLNTDQLKSSGIGKALMYLYKHPKEDRANKILASKLINEWSRPIFNLTSNYKLLTKEERQKRDLANLTRNRRLSSEDRPSRSDGSQTTFGEDSDKPRPGDPGWIGRARVPMPSHKDYVFRPESVIVDASSRGGRKKTGAISRYEKHRRAFEDRKRKNRMSRAVTINISGKNM